MSIKTFTKVWTNKNLKEMDKDSRTDLLYEHIPSLVSYYIKKAHSRQEEVSELFDRMEGDKFVSNLLRILKTHEEGTPVDLGMAVIIADFLAQRHDKLSEEMVAAYTKAINKILKQRIKKVRNKTGLEKDLVKELLVIIPEPETVSNPKFVAIYVRKVLNKLYALARDGAIELDTETLKKLFKQLFGKEMLNEVVVTVLLEYREKVAKFNPAQQTVWNQITSFALDTIEGFDKKEIRSFLEAYVERREKDAENGYDRARRIQFATINAEDYPKLLKAVGKLSDDDKYKEYLA